MTYRLSAKYAASVVLAAALVLLMGLAVLRAASGGPEAETYRACVDQSGTIRLLGDQLKGQFATECKKNEVIYEFASSVGRAELTTRLNALESRVSELENPPTPDPPAPDPPTPDPLADYQAVLDVLGSTGVILPLVDPVTGESVPAFQTIGATEAPFSWGGLPFDTSPTLQGDVPVVTFNGTDEEAETPDANYWTTTATNAFSVGAWINWNGGGPDVILGKYDATTSSEDREFLFEFDGSNLLELFIYDETADAYINQRHNTSFPTNEWHFVVGVYDGGTTTGALKLYLDGVAVQDLASSDGTFVSMQNGSTKPSLGFRTNASAVGSRFSGKMVGGQLGPFFTQIELSADQVAQLYNLGRADLGI